MCKYTLLLIVSSVLAGFAWMSSPVSAQGPIAWTAASGDWNGWSNWSTNFVPEGPTYGDTALINNSGVAMLTGEADAPVGGVSVGPGSLELTSSGSLSVVDASGVDSSATGFFTIAGTGILTLADTANVTVEGFVNLNGTTNISGPNAAFSTQSNLVFGSSGVYNADISNATTHSLFSADGTATLGGTLSVDFSGGVTPSLGDAWTLIDAAAINGSFETIQSPSGSLGVGQALGITQTAGGNGVLAQLTVQERLVLQVNRQTGATTLWNPGSAPVSIDGYTLQSTLGSLAADDGHWNSLQDQAISNWVEVPSNNNALGELNNSVGGSLTIASDGGQQLLGSAFSPELPFGSPSPEDVVFKYRDPTEGVLVGVVDYAGTFEANNLVLSVDTTTGNAQIANLSSTTSVDLQGYTITSVDGSLLASFESDLSNAQWEEVAGSANGIGELNPSGSTTLAPAASFNLTGMFSPGEAEDLVFQFRHAVGGEGDFNGDGQVDDADLTVWQQGFGTTYDGGDFLIWQRNFGSAVGPVGEIVTGIARYDGSFAAVAATTAIPEPTSAAIVLIGVLAIGAWRRRI